MAKIFQFHYTDQIAACAQFKMLQMIRRGETLCRRISTLTGLDAHNSFNFIFISACALCDITQSAITRLWNSRFSNLAIFHFSTNDVFSLDLIH